MQHTPGPWRVEPEGIFAEIEGSEYVVAVWDEDDGLSMEEMEANANLIAAAPDLLAAAKESKCGCSLRERDSGHKVGCWKPALDSAIAKAEGREHA